MTKEQLASLIGDFKAKGGKVKQVETGAVRWLKDPQLKNCQCGCEGDYTDHSMRRGEMGLH